MNQVINKLLDKILEHDTVSRRFFLTKSIAALTLAAIPAISEANTADDIVVDADELALNVEKYIGKTVEITGIAIHVCPVNGKKLKLETAQSNIIKRI